VLGFEDGLLMTRARRASPPGTGNEAAQGEPADERRMEPESQLRMGPVVVGYDGSDAARRGLMRAALLAAGRGAEFSTRAEEGAAAEVLARIARETDAALIVVGVRGHSFVTRALVGSVAADLVERAPCDLLVAR